MKGQNNSNNSIILRQQLRKDLRREDLQRRFKANRSIMKDIQIQLDRQEFYQIYPNIDQDNYQEHMDFFIRYLYNQDYNFMLVNIAAYPYQFMIMNPSRWEGYLILEGLSHFQEIQVPQTEEFAQIMTNHIFFQGRAIMNIIANLLSYPKYAVFLRQYLSQLGFLDVAEKYVYKLIEEERQSENQLYISYLFISICSSCIKIHPILPLMKLKQISIKIKQHMRYPEEYSLIFQSLDEISSSFQPNDQIASIFASEFTQIMVQQYFNYQQEVIKFAIYCTRSKVQINSLLPLLIKSLQTSKKEVLWKLLTFLSIHIKSHEQLQTFYYDVIKDYQVQAKIVTIFCISPINALHCLEILSHLVLFMVKEQNQSLYILIPKLIEYLDEPNIQLFTSSLKILHQILYLIVDQSCQKSLYLKILQQNAFPSKITALKSNSQSQTTIQQMLIFYNRIQEGQSPL